MDDIKAGILDAIDEAAHQMADDLSFVDQAAFLRGVGDALLNAEPDANGGRYYTKGYRAGLGAF